MKILEMMHTLEEAYDRFGDIDVNVYIPIDSTLHEKGLLVSADIKDIFIEAEEVIIKCEQ